MLKPIRFLLDENMPPAIAEGLTRRAVETATLLDLGRDGLSDTDQLRFARDEGWVIVTYDRDFLRLNDQGHDHAGIIWWKLGKYPYGQVIQWLWEYHHYFDLFDFRQQLIYL